ncbi:hypothetical protein PAXRUDRAFT_137213 [Paxillus rubicundulus Ve08.2h10]|uniref:Uncharacterized protein n=1 Tax=Paxillus rubicundulus Ve08.2h10 TaxID=930991 RepID=A0A0D0DTA7_9AGAM|nr:hypothetical protein PAXRUDRAFT_137213 [Paxillus rubicundulus Ve08.2h10]
MDTLPVDMSNPAIREYLSLVRLQVLTPLSLLINIATVLVCTVIVKPSIIGVMKLHPTSISPQPAWVATYVIIIYVFQVGYCLLLVFARKVETKSALVKAVGLSLVFANWAMAFWAIAWVLQWFLASTIFVGITVALLVYSNIALLVYHAPTSSRPFDMALIHAPLRFFMILPLSLMFPYSLFVTLGLAHSPDHPEEYDRYPWSGFAVVLAANLVGLVVILIRRDIIWALAATWICVSIWTAQPKPAPVFITVVLFTVLHPIALLSALIYDQLSHHRQGGIVLPPDDADHDAMQPERSERRGPREVDAEAVWGPT